MKNEASQVRDEYLKNEYRTNGNVAFFLLAFVVIGILNTILLRIDSSRGLIAVNDAVFIPINTILLGIVLIAWRFKFSKPWIKNMLLCGTILVSALSFFIYTTYTIYLVFIPIFIATRYFDKKLITSVSVITAVLFIISCFLNVELGATSKLMQTLHNGISYNPWERYLDAFVYIMTPCLLLMIFLAVFAANMTTSGRTLLSEKIKSKKKIDAVDAELSTAAEIQRSVLPKSDFQTTDGNFSLFAYETPAKEVCGDFYDYFMTDDSTLAFLVADVSDKGMPAAMFMMSAKKVMQCALASRDTLEEALALANKLICQDNECGMFLTLWMGVLDTKSGIGKYVNAGHPYPLIRHGDGSLYTVENEPNLFLGNFPELSPTVHTFRMKPQDTLLIYTDGLTDSVNPSGESFGLARVTEAFRTGKNVAEAVRDFAEGKAPFDDITLLTLQCNRLASPVVLDRALPIGIDSVASLNDEVQELLKAHSCPDEARRNIGVVIDEIGTNISSYAYESDGNIEFHAELGHNCMEMVFADSGVPFNPLQRETPAITGEAQLGGFGIFFVRSLSDAYSYEYADNRNKQKVLFIWNI